MQVSVRIGRLRVVLRLQVLLPVVHPLEVHPAHVARVRPLSRVRAHVLHEPVPQPELAPAVGALEESVCDTTPISYRKLSNMGAQFATPTKVGLLYLPQTASCPRAPSGAPRSRAPSTV